MADTTPVADAATLPSSDDIARVAAFTREPFSTEGDDAARCSRRALRAARRSTRRWPSLGGRARCRRCDWRRQWSLLLGLERLLSQDEPALADGTVLSAHQVDALSGTLTALLAEAQRTGNGNGHVRRRRRSSWPRPASPARRTTRTTTSRRSRRTGTAGRRGRPARRAAGGPERGQALLVRARDRRRQDGRGARLRRGLAHRRRADPHPPPQPRRPVPRRAARPRLREAASRRPLLGSDDAADGPVTVETYQWFVRNAGRISDAYTIVICDEAHTALGEKTSAAIRNWTGPIFIGMTATGALIARHVTDLFPTQTSRFDLAQAARRGVIAPLRCVRIPPGPGVRTIAKVPLRRGEVDTEFDQEMLAELLDQLPFNLAIADLYKTRFNGVPGVVYAAGVRHAYNVAQAFRDVGPEGAGGLRRDAQARAGADPRPLRARRHRRAGQRAAAGRGLELAARDGLHAPRADRLQAHLPAARRPRDAPPPGQGGRHRRRLRAPGDQARRPGRDAALAAGPRRLPRRRDRGRPGAPRPRPAAARRAARAAGHGRREPPDRGLRARAVADRRRAPRLRRADPVGGAGRRPRGSDRLAPGAGDAALRPGRRAQAHVPADRGRAQQEPAAAAAGAAGDRRRARRRGVRPGAGLRRVLAARGEARGRQGRAAGAGREARSAAATRPTTGSGAART